MAHPAVTQAVVVVHSRSDTRRSASSAYVVPEPRTRPVDVVRLELRGGVLPAYMVPARVVVARRVAAAIRTASSTGRRCPRRIRSAATEYRAPRTPVEEIVAGDLRRGARRRPGRCRRQLLRPRRQLAGRHPGGRPRSVPRSDAASPVRDAVRGADRRRRWRQRVEGAAPTAAACPHWSPRHASRTDSAVARRSSGCGSSTSSTPHSAAYNMPIAVRLSGDARRRRRCARRSRDVLDAARVAAHRVPGLDGRPASGDRRRRTRCPGPRRRSTVTEAELPRTISDARRPGLRRHAPRCRCAARAAAARPPTNTCWLLVVHHISADGCVDGAAGPRRDGRVRGARGGRRHRTWAPLPVQYADYSTVAAGGLGDETDDPASLIAAQIDYWTRGARRAARPAGPAR